MLTKHICIKLIQFATRIFLLNGNYVKQNLILQVNFAVKSFPTVFKIIGKSSMIGIKISSIGDRSYKEWTKDFNHFSCRFAVGSFSLSTLVFTQLLLGVNRWLWPCLFFWKSTEDDQFCSCSLTYSCCSLIVQMVLL